MFFSLFIREFKLGEVGAVGVFGGGAGHGSGGGCLLLLGGFLLITGMLEVFVSIDNGIDKVIPVVRDLSGKSSHDFFL